MNHPQMLNNVADPSQGWDQVAPEFIALRRASQIGVAAIQQWSNHLPAGAAILDLGCGCGEPLAVALIHLGFSMYGIDASPRLIAEYQRQYANVPLKCARIEDADFRRMTFASHCQPTDLTVTSGRVPQTLPVGRSHSLSPHTVSPHSVSNLPAVLKEVLPEQNNLLHATSQRVSCEEATLAQADFDAVMAVGLMFLLPIASQALLIEKSAAVLKPGGMLLFSAPLQHCSWLDVLTGRPSTSLGQQAYIRLAQQQGLRWSAEFSDEGENHYFVFVK